MEAWKHEVKRREEAEADVGRRRPAQKLRIQGNVGGPDRPNPELTKAIVMEADRRGLVALTCGARANVFRFLPALTISDALAAEGLALFADAFEAVV